MGANQPGASAEGSVVRGGNRTVVVRVPVVSYDQFGGVWWEGDAVANLDIPGGAKVPDFQVAPGGGATADFSNSAAAALSDGVTKLGFTPVLKGHAQCFGPDGVLKWETTFTSDSAAAALFDQAGGEGGGDGGH